MCASGPRLRLESPNPTKEAQQGVTYRRRLVGRQVDRQTTELEALYQSRHPLSLSLSLSLSHKKPPATPATTPHTSPSGRIKIVQTTSSPIPTSWEPGKPGLHIRP